MNRKHVSSDSPYEKSIGFSRAVRIGNRIVVSGTAPVDANGESVCPGDAYGQAKRCLEIIAASIKQAGGRLEDVIRTRVFVTDIALWEQVSKAHGEYFGEIRPAATMVQVSGLVRPEWLVEIEAECEITAE